MADKNIEEQYQTDPNYDDRKGFADFEKKMTEAEEETYTAADVTPNHVREAMEGSEEDGGDPNAEEAGAGEDAGKEDGGEAGAEDDDNAEVDDAAKQKAAAKGAKEEPAGDDDEDEEDEETRGKSDDELTEEQRERRKAGRYRRKFGKERSRAEEAERKLQEAERKLQELSARPQQPARQDDDTRQQPRQQKRDDEPVLDLDGKPLKRPDPKDYEFDTLDSNYTADLARYEGRKAYLETKRDDEARQEQTRQSQAQQDAKTKFDKMIVDGDGEYDDFADRVVANAQNYRLSKDMFDLALEEPDVGMHVLYHLATNPKEAARIADLTPAKQGVEFDRIASRFSQPNDEKSDPPQSAQTAATKRAPKATGPVKGVKGGGSAKPTPSKQSFAEFEAAELARQAKQ